MKPLYSQTATELKALLDTKQTTPREVAQAHLDRVRSLEDEIHAWAYIEQEPVDAQLKKIETLEPSAHPMFGIPIGVKDIYNTFDMPTQMGSPIWKDFTPGNDARMVHYLRRAGALMLGKTVTAEFAVHYQTDTRNPHDLKRSPGTSSSGSAAAVACGMVPIALGSQTAGSIGRPASYCGVYGFKPSFGVLPRIGVLKTTDSLDTLGFFSRSVEDLRLAFEASRVKGENYEFVHRYIDAHYTDPNRKFRVAVVEHPKYSLASGHAKEAFNTWVKTLEHHNIELISTKLPDFANEIYDIHQCIYDKALAYYFKDEYAKHTLMSPIFYDIIQAGQQITTQTYTDALEQQNLLAQEFSTWFESFDIILTLGAADEAPIGLTTSDTPDSNLLWTFLGLPSVMMPVLKGENGLPIGVVAVSKKYHDLTLMDFLQLLKDQSLINDTNIKD